MFYFGLGEKEADEIYCRIELAIGWWGGYDGYDLAALTVLSHGPAVSVSVCGRKEEMLIVGCDSCIF